MPLTAPVMEAVEVICGHLTERTATLFLGAGINAGTTNDSGEAFPLADELSAWICRDLLGDTALKLPLDEAAEIARYRLSNKAVNQYLYERFTSFRPGIAHLALVQLPWDVIYTTNFDLLVEAAATSGIVRPAGEIRAVFATDTDLASFSENVILYYKLHGSVDYANSELGRLILTKEDYRHYQLHRKPLFGRLQRDILSHTMVFVGYSLQDANLRSILSDCRDELGTKTFPLSYAVRPGFNPVQEAFWREKYNIQLLDMDATDFLGALKETWISENLSVSPFEGRRSRQYTQVDPSTRLPRVGDSFYRVSPADCTGQSNPELFFRGAEPSWADIREKIPPFRDDYWTLMEGLFEDLTEPSSPVSLYLVTGHAGTGKTTLLRTAAYDVAHDFKVAVLVHIPGTPLDARLLGPLIDEKNPQRILVIVHHAAEYVRELERFLEDARRVNAPLSVILEERRNQWTVATSTVGKRLIPAEIELGALSEAEIDRILDALTKYRVLEKLTGTPRSYQRQHFTALAEKELLVALRELTTGGSFDDIVRDEFNRIPSEVAKRAYVYVSALGQIGLALRYANLISILDLRYDQLGSEVFKPTDGVLISGEASGSSRHNAGFQLRARHPIIASIIFATAAPDDRSKFQVINEIISKLDPGFVEDRRLLEEIVRRKEIVNTLASPDNRRAIYERLQAILPDNPFVAQHRSILERDLGNPDLAVKYAREAVGRDNVNPVLLNTLGMALEFAARYTADDLPRRALLSEAARLFDDGIRRDPSDAYAYIGKVNLLKQEIEKEKDRTKRDLLQARALSLLEEAYDATNESRIIAGQLADQRQELGDPKEAIRILSKALESTPTDSRLRDLLIQFEFEEGKFKKALEIAMAGVKFDPTSWRLQRHAARLMRVTGGAVESIKGHYQAAIRHRRGDISLAVELGAFLFMNDLHSQATEVFNQARDLPVSAFVKRQIREWWKDATGQRIVFSGKVKAIRGAAAFALAIPQNFEAFFWRNQANLTALREGDAIRFTVGFNGHGPIARIAG
jgi:tetratricopeptide (TPR) repeat protein